MGARARPPTPVSFTIDTRQPDTLITRNPPASTEDGTAVFGYDSTEKGVRYECSLDGGTYAPC